MKFLQNLFKSLFLYVFRLVSFAVRRLNFIGKGIRFEEKVSDFTDIFLTTWFFFLLNLLALFIFLILPQGVDVILIIIEDLSSYHFGNFFFFLIGLTWWCVVSEFGARYKIYITDNSGMSLTDERVNFRKEAQKFVSSIYLLFPVVIALISVVTICLSNITNWGWQYIWPFALVVISLVLMFAGLSKFYLDDFYTKKLRTKKVWFKVDEKELRWANKLYGIYNDHVFMIRKAKNFKDNAPNANLKTAYSIFVRILQALPNKSSKDETKTIESFPRDYIKDDELAPVEFKKVDYRPNNFEVIYDQKTDKFKNVPARDGYYRWIYENTPSFYKTLHFQVHVIVITSLIIILLVSTKFLLSYEVIGSPGLICLSFASWLGIVTGINYVDGRFRRNIKISLRLILVLWFIIVSFINNDHPIHTNNSNYFEPRLSLNDHFSAWKKEHFFKDTVYIIDSIITKMDTVSNSSLTDTIKSYPVFFVTAEGGALRTGAFTALLLAHLQDSFKTFKDHIYAFSSVSGGSVGVSFFNAITYIQPPDSAINKKDYYKKVTSKFFDQDQLSPVIGKMFYGDFLNNFWPWHIDNFDRAIALEKAWEHSYAVTFNAPNDRNVYSTNFLSCYQNKIAPAWFINTTEVETGLQCFLSNVKADKFLFADDRDLFTHKLTNGVNYSTAINFSSRFPLFSPSAAIYKNDDQTYHYIDGGYVENTGSKTMYEVLQSLKDSIKDKHIIPYVIHVKYGDSVNFQKTGFLNEINSIVSGIYNTRSGASATYTELLKQEVNNFKGYFYFISIPLTAKSYDVPLSWVFSERSLRNLNKVVDGVLKDSTNDLHRYLPYFQKASTKHKRPNY